LPCGLTQDCLNLLYYLYRKKALSEKHSRSILAINRDVGDKIDLEEAFRSLAIRGFVGCKKKRASNYWAVPGAAIRALTMHDYAIFRSGFTRL